MLRREKSLFQPYNTVYRMLPPSEMRKLRYRFFKFLTRDFSDISSEMNSIIDYICECQVNGNEEDENICLEYMYDYISFIEAFHHLHRDSKSLIIHSTKIKNMFITQTERYERIMRCNGSKKR